MNCVKPTRSVPQPPPRKGSWQQGTVLITAMLAVALISGLALGFASQFQLSLKRGEQRLYSGQLQQYVYGMENFATWGLRKDSKDDANNYGSRAAVDHLGEDWSTAAVEAPLEAGYASGSLEDAQGRFNINQLALLVNPARPNGSFIEKYTPQQKRFMRLLQTRQDNPVSPAVAEEITQAVIDWIDGDSLVTGIGGAENDFYRNRKTPYRAANQPLVSVSELRLVRGMTDDLYEFLVPLVVALPDTGAGININTALPEVIRTLNAPDIETPLDTAEAEILQSSLPTENQNQELESGSGNRAAYESVNDFLDSDDVRQVFGVDVDGQPSMDGLATGSDYFLLTMEVEMLDVKRRTRSLLHRSSDNSGSAETRVIRRGSADIL